MGRGRQKAKQTKVARELKYSIYEPNYRALEQELAHSNPADADPYAEWADAEDDADEDDDLDDEDDEPGR